MLNYARQGIKHLIYDGVNLSDYFELADIKMMATPDIGAQTVKVPAHAGEYFESRTIGTRTINATFRLDTESRNPIDMMIAWNEYKNLLFKDTPRPLYLTNNLYCLAIAQGSSEIKPVGTYALIDVEFVCFDPYLYGGKTDTYDSGLVRYYPKLADSDTSTERGAELYIKTGAPALLHYVKVYGLYGCNAIIEIQHKSDTDEQFALVGKVGARMNKATGHSNPHLLEFDFINLMAYDDGKRIPILVDSRFPKINSGLCRIVAYGKFHEESGSSYSLHADRVNFECQSRYL